MADYQITYDYRDNRELRAMYVDYARSVFSGADFAEWSRLGFWTDRYDPHSIVIDNQIVANVSAARIDLIVEGEVFSGIQLGAVGTREAYRGRGLSRVLMEHVVAKYRDDVDTMFLFANDGVTDFYPRFGFQSYQESLLESTVQLSGPAPAARRIDITQEADRALVRRLTSERIDITHRFGARNYGYVTAWHLLNPFAEKAWYVADDDALVILSEDDRQINVWEVITTRAIDLMTLLPKAARGRGSRVVRYHFPPDQYSFSYDRLVRPVDSTLFVLGRFPIRNEPFKFPVTAET
ncbi:GNAT family N-acetyltransferase [candidate division GN15 bacterium]|nr:GNAT family N-acetyltransferase [candidate division GN15 bacterium]